jgi:hypothetical protein
MATPRKSQTLARGTRRLADASLPDLTKPQLLSYADASAVLGLGIPTLERMVANSTFRTAPGAMENVVPVERIELPTFGLQNRCSTAELNRRIEGDGVVGKTLIPRLFRALEYQTCPQRARTCRPVRPPAASKKAASHRPPFPCILC